MLTKINVEGAGADNGVGSLAYNHIRSLVENEYVDLEKVELWMIVRACDNFERLGLTQSERMFQFDEWFHANFVGILFPVRTS
jgi:hypothetical protein